MVHTLPFSDIQVPYPGFGAMGLSAYMGTDLTYDEAEPVLLKAIELGCTFWDTAVSCAMTGSLWKYREYRSLTGRRCNKR